MTKKEAIKEAYGNSEYTEDIIKALSELPLVTPTCKVGEWINKDASGYNFYGKCSECGQEFQVSAWYTQNMRYCPNCGCKMLEIPTGSKMEN